MESEHQMTCMEIPAVLPSLLGLILFVTEGNSEGASLGGCWHLPRAEWAGAPRSHCRLRGYHEDA